MTSVFWRRLGSAIVITAVMFGPLGWFLLTRVTDRVDRALANDWTTAAAAPVGVVVSAFGAALGRAHARGWRWAAVLVIAAIHGASFVWVASRYF